MPGVWYPGHMGKAKRTLLENIKLVDVVIEVRDARAPDSTANPDIRTIAGSKPLVIVLNKVDLANPAATTAWVQALRAEGHFVLAVNALAGRGMGELLQYMRASAQPMLQKRAEKGIRGRAIRVMVVGIPNVGKSQIINRLVGRTATRTGDQPGITRGKQWVKIAADFELLDTPGILWPKLKDPEAKMKLAMVGTIAESEYNAEEVAMAVLFRMGTLAPAELLSRYNLTELMPGLEMLLAIGRKRGCLRAGGEVDRTKAAVLVLRDFQTGAFGRLTLELPAERTAEATISGGEEPAEVGENDAGPGNRD